MARYRLVGDGFGDLFLAPKFGEKSPKVAELGDHLATFAPDPSCDLYVALFNLGMVPIYTSGIFIAFPETSITFWPELDIS